MMVAAALAVAIGASAPAPALPSKRGYYRSCGDGYPNYNYTDLRAHGLSCSHARHFAAHHFTTEDEHFNGWTCHDKHAYESGSSRCRRHHHRRPQEFKYFFGV